MKKNLLILMLIGIVSVIVTCASIAYAWFTFQKPTKEINAETSGVSFTFKISDSTYTSNYQYSVSNLAFFDVTDPDELDDFLSMSCEISVKVINTSKSAVSYSIYQSLPATLSGEYIYCLLSSTQITATTITNLNDNNSDDIISISDLYSATNTLSGNLTAYSSTASVITDEVDFYIYLFGVHDETNDADNDDNSFLDDTYSFAVSIKCKDTTPTVYYYDPSKKNGGNDL